MSDTTGRRIVRVSIEPSLLQNMFTVGRTFDGVTVAEGLPEGAMCVGSAYDPQRLTAELFFVHESFDIVDTGNMVPQFPIVYERRQP